MKLSRRTEIIVDHAKALYHYTTQFHRAYNERGANDLIMAIDGVIMHCEQMKNEVEEELKKEAKPDA